MGTAQQTAMLMRTLVLEEMIKLLDVLCQIGANLQRILGLMEHHALQAVLKPVTLAQSVALPHLMIPPAAMVKKLASKSSIWVAMVMSVPMNALLTVEPMKYFALDRLILSQAVRPLTLASHAPTLELMSSNALPTAQLLALLGRCSAVEVLWIR